MKYMTLRFNANGYYAHMCGMNNKGLFATVQMVPGKSVTPVPGEQTITTYDLLLSSLKHAETIDQVKQILGDKRLVHIPTADLHCMFADRYGHVLVVEVGTKKNHVYENKDNHFAMTNFNFSDNEGKPEESIGGFGADRYHTGLAELRAHMNNFNSDIAMQTMAKMSQPVTLSSMVFLPEKNHVYIALSGNSNSSSNSNNKFGAALIAKAAPIIKLSSVAEFRASNRLDH